MGRAEIRTRIADLIEADITGLTTVLRFTPDAVADYELPCLFVSGTVETNTQDRTQDSLKRDQAWIITLLWQAIGLGWSETHQDKLDDTIDAMAALLAGKRGLRTAAGIGLDMVNAAQYTGCRVTTPYAFPVNQNQKYYHAVEFTLVVQTEQLC